MICAVNNYLPHKQFTQFIPPNVFPQFIDSTVPRFAILNVCYKQNKLCRFA